MKAIRIFLKRNVEEIRNSTALRWYGIFLSGTHILSFFFWNAASFNVAKVLSDDVPVCWTFNPSCGSWRPLPAMVTESALYGLLLLAIIAAILFIFEKYVSWAYAGLMTATFLKLLIMFQDYRMMGNYHYMAHIALFVFLFLPRKIEFAKYFVVGFYVAASLIKFNMDWLGGHALLRPSIFSGKLLELSLAYVVLLELLGSWFLLSKRACFFWLSLAQFILFHIFSWHIVGYFYPCIMFCLLSIFVLNKIFPEKTSDKNPSPFWGSMAFAAFSICQLIPLVFYPDSAITGKGRLLSLNMLDARAVCENKVFVKDHETTYQTSLTASVHGIRVRCDPLVYIYEAQALCKKLQSDRPQIDLDLALYARRSSDTKFDEVLKLKSVCSHPVQIGLLGEIQ